MSGEKKGIIILICLLLVAIFIIAFVFIRKGRKKPITNIEIAINTMLIRNDKDIKYLAGDRFVVEQGQSNTEYYTPINIDISSSEYVKYVYTISNNINKVAYCEIYTEDCVLDNYLVSIKKAEGEEASFTQSVQFEVAEGEVETIEIYFRINDVQYDALISGQLVLKVESL